MQAAESVARTVKVAAAALVAVPLTTPVLVPSVRPEGSVPLLSAHVYGEMPPLALSVWEKAVPTAGVLSVAGPTVTVGQMGVKELASVPMHPFESVARSVKLTALELVTVPESTPVVAFSVRPAGSVPVATAKV